MDLTHFGLVTGQAPPPVTAAARSLRKGGKPCLSCGHAFYEHETRSCWDRKCPCQAGLRRDLDSSPAT